MGKGNAWVAPLAWAWHGENNVGKGVALKATCHGSSPETGVGAEAVGVVAGDLQRVAGAGSGMGWVGCVRLGIWGWLHTSCPPVRSSHKVKFKLLSPSSSCGSRWLGFLHRHGSMPVSSRKNQENWVMGSGSCLVHSCHGTQKEA